MLTSTRERLVVRRAGLWCLAGILSVFVFLATLYNLLVPIAEGPDELQHIAYINLLVERPWLPNLYDDIHRSSEVIQPPLYYTLMAILPRALDQRRLLPPELSLNPGFSWSGLAQQNTLMHTDYSPRVAVWTNILRVCSTFIGAATVGVIYLCGRQIWTQRRLPALLAAAIAALTPQFVYMAASVTNDIFSTFWCALLTLMMLKALAGDRSFPLVVGMGLVTGLGALTKYTVLPVAALAVPILLLGGADRSWRRRARDLAIFLAAAACVSGWWFARNIWLYGDLTASGAMQSLHSVLVEPKPLTSLFWAQGPFLRSTFQSYWGTFGSLSVLLPAGIYRLFLFLSAVAGIGILASFIMKRQARPSLLLLLATMGIAFAAYVAHNATFAAVHGRLLFPALPAISLLLAGGIISLADLAAQSFRRVWVRRGLSPGTVLRVIVAGLIVTLLLGINLWCLRRPIQSAFNLQPDPHLAPFAQAQLRLTTPICCERSHGQTFVAEGRLMRIDVVLSAADPLDRRSLVLHLRASATSSEDLRTVIIGRDQVAVGGYQRFEFAPLDLPSERSLYFEIEAQDTEPGGVAARYTASNTYAGGMRFEDGMPVDGDLQFVLFYND